ncbi:hypothetical protein F4778DRAFT_756674 [Xylariomycetidae sp. FL2044]|nr:hypothetical protein F4778DRAFT_756674 [Xylariomycetidae sp. FL2044]
MPLQCSVPLLSLSLSLPPRGENSAAVSFISRSEAIVSKKHTQVYFSFLNIQPYFRRPPSPPVKPPRMPVRPLRPLLPLSFSGAGAAFALVAVPVGMAVVASSSSSSFSSLSSVSVTLLRAGGTCSSTAPRTVPAGEARAPTLGRGPAGAAVVAAAAKRRAKRVLVGCILTVGWLLKVGKRSDLKKKTKNRNRMNE